MENPWRQQCVKSVCLCVRGTEGESYSAVSRVRKGAWEGGDHTGFVRIVSFQIAHCDLQSDILLVAEREHRHAVLPSDKQKLWACVSTNQS